MGDMSVAQVYNDYMAGVLLIFRSFAPVIIVSFAITLAGMLVDLAHLAISAGIPFTQVIRMKYGGGAVSSRKLKKLNKAINDRSTQGEGFTVKNRTTREVKAESSSK